MSGAAPCAEGGAAAKDEGALRFENGAEESTTSRPLPLLFIEGAKASSTEAFSGTATP